jgi:hypothetical protein
MNKYYLLVLVTLAGLPALTQSRKLTVIGSSTSAGLAASPIDSAWVNRFNYYYCRHVLYNCI